MATRPGGVTLVAVLAWLSGALNVVSGILILAGVVPNVLGTTAAAWVAVGVGVLVILVSVGLFRGSQLARVLTAISFLANLAGSVWLMFAHPGNLVSPVVSAFLAVIGLVLLFTRAANDFFRR